jgi:peptidoglycan/LPS O-acetylase OafA/YrhL
VSSALPVPASRPAQPDPVAPAPATGGNRIPSLDGLRAVSILLVLFGHLCGTPNFLPLKPWGDLNTGEFGVRVFFVISGFLITTLLIKEEKKTGTVSLRGFYVRRFYRIFPAFYTYLAVMLTLAAASVIQLFPGDAIHAVTFTMNHHPDASRSWWVGHLWSLSVEEQFYLLWPPVVAFLGLRRGLSFVATGAVFLAPVVRMGYWYLRPQDRSGIGEVFPTICDAIATGCLLAGAREWLGRQPRYLRLLRSPLGLLLPVIAFVISLEHGHARVYFAVGETVENVALALFIDRLVRFPEGPLGRLFNSAPLEFVGKLSYSIYLWQQPFMNRTAPSTLTSFPLNVVLAAGAALTSYYVIEKPVLDYRARRTRH